MGACLSRAYPTVLMSWFSLLHWRLETAQHSGSKSGSNSYETFRGRGETPRSGILLWHEASDEGEIISTNTAISTVIVAGMVAVTKIKWNLQNRSEIG